MSKFVKNRVRKFLVEQQIDGENMNNALQSLCDTISVSSYDEVIQRVTMAIGPQNKNPQLWAKIEKPLSMLSQASSEINKEKHTTYDGNPSQGTGGMTGDSMVDEGDTWWSAIQSTLCEQGSAFV